mmetsp:Transcript_13384/g.32787  ORF Transcript_13384/g.32787 Transcript_13384/m.32787 type:complete len:624 (+) Transcript_13384:934-2805(+)
MEIANLPDREERIAARRRRAETKLRREKEEQEAHPDDLLEEQPQGLGKQRVAEASAFLERLQYDTTSDLSDIRVRFDNEENERRIIEENARLDRYEALQIEAVSSGRKNAAVELKWADLLYIDIPQELHDQLLLQKEACLNILEGKDRRIREFLTELKNKDEEYQKMLKRQAHDVNLLIKKMRAQYVGLQEKHDDQVGEIENAFAQERTDLMKKNREDVEALFEKRRMMEETEFMDQRGEREKKFAKKIDELREQDEDEYNNSRIALEKSIQELETHFEKMMATYQLNKEKLDYNLQVLIERNKEHSAIQSSYKNRLNRLRETLTLLLSRYGKLDAKYKQENQDLTEEYKRLTKQFKDLQDKHTHFEKADEVKFREVWAMNETEAKTIVSKILECDKLIHEQQLNVAWSSPQEELLNEQFETGTSTEAGTQTGTKSLSKNMSSAGGQGGEQKKAVEFFAKRTKKSPRSHQRRMQLPHGHEDKRRDGVGPGRCPAGCNSSERDTELHWRRVAGGHGPPNQHVLPGPRLRRRDTIRGCRRRAADSPGFFVGEGVGPHGGPLRRWWPQKGQRGRAGIEKRQTEAGEEVLGAHGVCAAGNDRAGVEGFGEADGEVLENVALSKSARG